MKKLDLNNYSDREIANGIINLPAYKFMAVLNALDKISTKMQNRGELIAGDTTNDSIDKLIQEMLEEE